MAVKGGRLNVKILTLLITSPKPLILREINECVGRKVNQTVSYLKRMGYISYSSNRGYILTSKGKKYLYNKLNKLLHKEVR